MEFKLGSYKNEWNDTGLPDEANDTQKVENISRLSQFVTDILLSENLVVLTGLGTSLSAVKCDPVQDKEVFIAPKMSDLWNEVKNLDSKKFDSMLKKVKYDSTISGENIEFLLSRCQLYQKLDPSNDIQKFLEGAEQAIVKLCDFVDDHVKIDAHEMFLRKVARRGARLPRAQIFTTNYDLCFEKAASRTRFIVTDGFSSSVPPEFDGMYFNYDFVNRGASSDHSHNPEFVPNVFQLHKLHGSIDWESTEGVIRKTSERKRPCIIYPQDGKYESSYSTPYLELMGRFQSGLRKQNLGLIIVGFGFNDNHISHPVLQSLRSNVHLKVLIVDPALTTTINSHLKKIEALADSGDWRVGMMACTFEEFVKFLPDILKESDSDLHFKRVKGLV